MADHSGIEWTDATWNPTTGCTKISPGCAHCYIERTPAFRIAGRRFNRKGHIPLQLHEDRLEQPQHWRKPRRIFVNSLSDLFHDDVPFAFVDRVFLTMQRTPHHQYQLLTKRPVRMRKYILSRGQMFALARGPVRPIGSPPMNWPPQNVWLIVSVENQPMADARIPELLATPAAVRGVSAEPLLDDIDLTPHLHGDTLAAPGPSGFRKGPRLDWVIVGGESGPGARPMHPEWARSIRDQCVAAGVSYFFKQWGEWIPISQRQGDSADLYRHYARTARHPDGRSVCKVETKVLQADGRVEFAFPQGAMQIFRVGKKAAGRLLDGREWNEFPEVRG